MGTLKYRGRPPDTDFTLLHKRYTDDHYDAVKVDNAFVNVTVATEAVPLATPAYVDGQDNLRDHIAAVDTADAGYLAATSLGVVNGVASLGSDTYVPSSQLPALTTERRGFLVNASSVLLTSTQEITNTGNKGFEAARLTINDPGYAYTALFFAYAQGGSVQGTQPARTLGTGSFGQISVLRDDNTKYAWCFCNSANVFDTFCAKPFADTTISPTVRPPLYGTTNFSMWLGLWSGSTYSFTPTGLRFFALVFPGF
jgi:hypothetical protein